MIFQFIRVTLLLWEDTQLCEISRNFLLIIYFLNINKLRCFFLWRFYRFVITSNRVNSISLLQFKFFKEFLKIEIKDWGRRGMGSKNVVVSEAFWVLIEYLFCIYKHSHSRPLNLFWIINSGEHHRHCPPPPSSVRQLTISFKVSFYGSKLCFWPRLCRSQNGRKKKINIWRNHPR